MRGYTHKVVKQHKRLWIERLETGERIYTPPDFLRHRMHGRDELLRACERLDAMADFADVIMEFETSLRPDPVSAEVRTASSCTGLGR